MRRLNMLIQRDVDAINAAACWTDEQKRLFDHLLSDRLLKDISTVRNDPARLWRWAEIALEETVNAVL